MLAPAVPFVTCAGPTLARAILRAGLLRNLARAIMVTIVPIRSVHTHATHFVTLPLTLEITTTLLCQHSGAATDGFLSDATLALLDTLCARATDKGFAARIGVTARKAFTAPSIF